MTTRPNHYLLDTENAHDARCDGTSGEERVERVKYFIITRKFAVGEIESCSILHQQSIAMDGWRIARISRAPPRRPHCFV